jgi:hypothetical protein
MAIIDRWRCLRPFFRFSPSCVGCAMNGSIGW